MPLVPSKIRWLPLSLALAAAPATAQQQLELPHPSPSAKVSQRAGLTDISVEYSSPGVKGRKIWGAVVQYDQVWRAGANSATKVTFSKDVKVGDTAVPAGTYAFFVIPGKSTWTLILSKEPNQPGAFAYKQEQDLLRYTAKPQAIPSRERLAYLIGNFNDDSASLDLEWEKVRVSLPIKLSTADQALANINAATEASWAPLNQAARYMLETKKDYDAGLALVEKSLALKEDWFNVWTKASLLAAKKDYANAYPLAEKAKTLGDSNKERFFAADDVSKALAEWKGKH
jgi:hypothetical protein